MSKYRVLLALLLVLSLGCGLLGGDGDDAEAGDNGGVSQDDGGGDEGASGDDVQIEDLAGVDSYRSRTAWLWTPDAGEPEGMSSEEEYTRDPDASRIAFESNGEGYEFVQIEDQAWYCFASTCALTQMSEEDAMSGFGMGLDDLGFDESDLTYRGRETLNGISTRHYTVDLTLAALIALGQGDVSDVEAEAWIADERDLPSFVVKYESSWREERTGGAGVFEWSYEVYDINTSFTIEPPEGAAGWPDDVPQYPGATDVTIMEDLITFSTDDSASAVAEFYGGALAAAGWTMQSEMDMGAVMQTWTKGGQTLSLTIAEEEGATSVLIAIS